MRKARRPMTAPVIYTRASMGPQLDSCGRIARAAGTASFTMLQWGRNLTVAEGPGRRQVGRPADASMGPQLDSCGRMERRRPSPRAARASMGPQLDSCGRGSSQPELVLEIELQWGRNLTVAEGGAARPQTGAAPDASMGPQLDSCGRACSCPGAPHKRDMLQWGRNLTVAEGACGERVVGKALASMGPQLDSCGRRRPGRRGPRRLLASMGPQLDSCGRVYAARTAALEALELQWGRNLTVAEGMSSAAPGGSPECFNGAAT